MANIVEAIGTKLVEELLNLKDKPYLSAWMYLTSGIIGSIGCFSIISPFSRSVTFLDAIVWKRNLSDSEFVVQFAFWMTVLCVVYSWIRKFWVCACTNKPSKEIRVIYMRLYAIDDLIDLVTAVASLLLVVSFFLQVYNTGTGFISIKAGVVYMWVAYKFLAFIYARFANHNLKIIDDVIKKYPDLD